MCCRKLNIFDSVVMNKHNGTAAMATHCFALCTSYRVKCDPYTGHCRGLGVWAYLGRVFSIAEQLGMHTTCSIGPLFGQKFTFLEFCTVSMQFEGSLDLVSFRVWEGEREREGGRQVWLCFGYCIVICYFPKV